MLSQTKQHDEDEIRIEDLVKDAWLRQNVVEHFSKIVRQSQELGWRSIAGVLSSIMRDPSLQSRQRRLLTDTLYDMVRKLRRLKALSGLKSPTTEQYYGLWLFDSYFASVPKEPQKSEGSQSLRREIESLGFAWGPTKKRFDDLEEACHFIEDTESAESLSDARSYPTWQVKALLAQYGMQTTQKILEGQNHRAPLSIRVNTLKTSKKSLSEALLQAGIQHQDTLLSSSGLLLKTRTNVYGLAPFQEGHFELQDEGSQLIAELVAPPPAGIVIDACAGAGGKTLALGALMQNKGRIIAIDIDAKKLIELRKRIRRAGLSNVQTIKIPDEESLLADSAHRVLCDVPCSGLGVLRRHPEARWAIQKSDVEELTKKQKSILSHAASFVKQGGRLIYSTCTLLAEENEHIVQEFLQNHPEFILMPVKEIWGTERAMKVGDGTFLKILPILKEGPDGFFCAVLRKL